MSTREQQPLEEWVANGVAHGWRVESRTDTQAVMVRGRRPNHLLHLLLSIITLGLWIPIWILVSVFGREKRKVLSTDANGQVTTS